MSRVRTYKSVQVLTSKAREQSIEIALVIRVTGIYCTQDLYGWTKWGNTTFENTLHLSIAEVMKCVSGLIWGLFGATTACKTLCFHCLSLRKVTIFEHKMSHERTFRQPNNQFATTLQNLKNVE